MGLLLRALVSWLLTCAWLFFVSLGAMCLGFGNFVVAWQSFTAQGFEPVPLREVPLLGAWAEGLGLGDAPLAALYALVLTLAMNIAIIATAKALARALRLFFDRRQVLRSDDPVVRATAPDYLDQTVHASVWAGLLVVASVLIIAYDVAQFTFRYETLFSEIPDPAEALDWAPDAVARLGEFLAGFIRTATWGYVGCVIAMAVALEHGLGRAAERWEALHSAVARALDTEAQAFAEDRQEAPAVAGESPAPVAEPGEEVPAFAEPAVSSVTPTRNTPIINGPVPLEPISPPATPEPPPAPPPANGPMVEVIVAPGRVDSFPLAEVQADAERFVRDGSGRTWFLRDYWEQVMGNHGPMGANA